MTRVPARDFRREDILRWLGERNLAKGEDYLRAVSQLHVGDQDISALVQGTARRPYTVRISFRQKTPHFGCTCPLGGYCKHSVAVLLMALAARDEHALAPDPRVLGWLEELRALASPPKAAPKKPREQLFYMLDFYPESGRLGLDIYKARPLADGACPETASTWHNIERALISPPSFVTEEDLAILRLLWLCREEDGYYTVLRLDARKVDDLMPRLLASGRCYFEGALRLRLRAGGEAKASLDWQPDDEGLLRARAEVQGRPEALALPTQPLWYVDVASGECGPLDAGMAPALVAGLLAAPPLKPLDAALVAREFDAMGAVAAPLPKPKSRFAEGLRELKAELKPRLSLSSVIAYTRRKWRSHPQIYSDWLDLARPVFQYEGLELAPEDKREFHRVEGETLRLVRDEAAEAAALAALKAQGFERLPDSLLWSMPEALGQYGLASEAAWGEWMSRIAPALRAAGWALVLDPSFRHHVVELDELFAEVEEGEAGWFDVSLGFELEGRRIALAPLLAGLLREHPQLASGKGLDRLSDTARLELMLDDGQRVRFAAARIKPVLRMFIDLFDGDGDSLRVSRLDAPRLADLAKVADTSGLQAVNTVLERLQGTAGVSAVPAPEGLGVQLRTYQLEGLSWLQHLRANELGGILADDMGLGKTAQTLAHLLTEKLAGRLDRPSLVILPTSLVFNWKREAAHMAPALSVLALHGPERDFAAIARHDVVLTTYPLVWRDAEELKRHDYHLLILDEAQTVKNAASKAAATVRELRARHRLCLTGTPMENHLGELWTQFDFLLPGFLGDVRDFTRRWRTPIEKGGDALRRELLARRVKPFILRRRKEEVACELPPKSIVLRTVALEGGQRDLYETVRAAMDEKVREEVAAKGFKRSQIVILDALLKLRQVCCDPRLLSLASVAKVKERAKLDLLMEMLPELVEEGRRVLVFSQFTTMLGLIEAELDKLGIGYTKLTGQTRKREEAVGRFQRGEVPIFLISLKAGGVGLNLTQADTVIHFDPWWNPAAEDQATDRAHRIGQTKPVFVYKLIAEGSIEERILGLQEKKAALAASVLGGDAEGELKFSEAELASLFAPLPEIEGKAAGTAKRGRRSRA